MSVPEERWIVERIKDFIKSKKPRNYYIMLKNGHIIDIHNYRKMVSDGNINPQDAYVYIEITILKGIVKYKAFFYYPFLESIVLLLEYFSKLGFDYGDFVVPATGIKYIADAMLYGDYLSIEVVNLDTIVDNTNLRKIVFEVAGEKLVSGVKKLTDKESVKIFDMFASQKLFAGYNFDGALSIIIDYYDNDKQSLAKEVARIAMAYVDIFHPYRTCYDMKTWKEVDCWSIKLD